MTCGAASKQREGSEAVQEFWGIEKKTTPVRGQRQVSVKDTDGQ
jgi:hypothetical protein